jgi:hypothetical protein
VNEEQEFVDVEVVEADEFPLGLDEQEADAVVEEAEESN